MSDPIGDWGNLQTPYSQEAEEATLGAIIINESQFAIVAGFLHADDFFILRHRYIWECLERLKERNEPVDNITLANELKSTGRLKEIGGPAYITQLVNQTPTSVHAEVYGRLVERAATRRRLMAGGDQIKALALDEEKTVDDIIGDVEKIVTTIVSGHDEGREKTFYDLISGYFDKVDHLMTDPSHVVGIPTGFKELDKLMLGAQAPDLIIPAGRPGMGKSSFLLSLTMNRFKEKPNAVIGWFPLEMSSEQMTQRAISLESGINIQHLTNGTLTADEWKRFVQKSGEISKYKLLIDDRPHLTPSQVRSKIYKWMARYGKLDFIVVDYIQLMSGGKGFGPNNRQQEISFISEELKNMCKEFNVPIYAAAQLSREVEKRKDKRPILSDLRESGALEQNADIVMFLYRDEVYNEATEFPNQADVIIAKHRNGPTGTVSLYFEKTLTKFMNSAQRTIDLSYLESPSLKYKTVNPDR